MRPQQKFKIDPALIQKFTNKMERLIENRQSQQSEDPEAENPNAASQQEDSPVTPIKKIISQSSDPKQKLRSSNLGTSSQQNYCSNAADNATQNNKYESNARKNQNQVIEIDDRNQADNQQPQSQKIDVKQLARLIALEKKKAQQARANMSVSNTSLKKAVANSSKSSKSNSNAQISKAGTGQGTLAKNSNNQSVPTSKPKVQFKMPKVNTMNNLIKLSTRLSQRDMLKQIMYRASVTNVGPTRLLLYFSIQKILHFVYQENGVEKMNQKMKDVGFLTKQITLGLLNLLKFLKINQRTMIYRILMAVFARLGISQIFSNRWLTDFVKANRQAIIAAGVKPEDIQSPPTTANISSQIFTGISTMTTQPSYSHLRLSLENQNDSQQRIDDPQVFHSEQKLFFFQEPPKQYKNTSRDEPKVLTKQPKKLPTRSKNNQNRLNIVQPEQTLQFNIQTHSYDGNNFCQNYNNYEPTAFTVLVKKVEVPLNIKIFSNWNNPNEYQITRNPKIKQKKDSRESDEQIIMSKKRNRQFPRAEIEIQQCKIQRSDKKKEGQNNISETKIKKLIDEHIFSNMDYIADKLAQKLKIKPQQLRKFIKDCDQANSLPSKERNPASPQKQKPKKQIEENDDIIKAILLKQVEFEKKNVNRKQIVKQILLFLEKKKLDDDRKQKILDKWIEIKKQRQKQNIKNGK